MQTGSWTSSQRPFHRRFSALRIPHDQPGRRKIRPLGIRRRGLLRALLPEGLHSRNTESKRTFMNPPPLSPSLCKGRGTGGEFLVRFIPFLAACREFRVGFRIRRHTVCVIAYLADGRAKVVNVI